MQGVKMSLEKKLRMLDTVQAGEHFYHTFISS